MTSIIPAPSATTVLPTGEAVEAFDMAAFLKTALSDGAFQQQQALAAAYDRACAALIGPNDVQKEGNRTFKKKSAWLKLGRLFHISTRIVRQTYATADDLTLAVCVVEARAPWGQTAEAVGACGADEEIGKRRITLADMLATAQTRATNRAVSNLIAMGEVSAEEVQRDRHEAGDDEAIEAITPDSIVDWGKYAKKPTAIRDLPTPYLEWAVQEGRRFGPRTLDWQAAMTLELADRQAKAAPATEAEATTATEADDDIVESLYAAMEAEAAERQEATVEPEVPDDH